METTEQKARESTSPCPHGQGSIPNSPPSGPKSPRKLSFGALDKERGSFDATPHSPKHSAATTTMLLMHSPLVRDLPNGDDEKFRISSESRE